MVAVPERLDGGFDDVPGGLEIRLSDTEIYDRAALRLERLGARQDLEGAFGADAAHGRGGFQHGLVSLPKAYAVVAAGDKPRAALDGSRGG